MKINLFQNHTYFRAQGKIRTGPFGREGGRPSVLRGGGQDAVYQYSGRDDKQTVDTEEEIEDELLVRREGWEIDVFVTATDNGVFTESYNLF